MNPSEFNEKYEEAQSGDPHKMLDIALAFYEGDGVDQNKAKFFEWVSRSANAGVPEAAYELADAYRYGRGTKPDQDRYVEWLNQASDLGWLRAVYDIAIRYKDGDGVLINEKHFFKLMKEAAEGGYGDAMLELAFAYRDSIGTTKRLVSYFRWLKRAAEAGNAEAMFHLAFAYKKREGTPKRNMKAFFQWLYEAAKRAKPDALFHLAIAYQKGEGTKRSPNKYSYWMKKAAYAGKREARYHLAMYYLTKSRPDLEKFSEWIKEALKAGDEKAFIASGLDDLRKELQISPNDLIALHEDLDKLYETVMRIKQTHLVKENEAKNGVAHFTGFGMLDSILPENPPVETTATHLRLYNFAYMNDPQEGKRLLDEKFIEGKSLREFFSGEDDMDNPLSWEGHESSVYIGAFTLKGDDLDMWKTEYGQSGEGYCIVTPLESYNQDALNEPEDLHGGEEVKVTEGASPVSTQLYAVRYKEKDVKATLNKLKPKLDTIIEKRKALQHHTKPLDRTVRLIVSHILYLYKNDHYQSEEEARLIGTFDISFAKLKLDPREKPSKIYVESPDFLLREGSRIIIGPKVPKQTIAELDLKYRLARHRRDKVEVFKSNLTNMYR